MLSYAQLCIVARSEERQQSELLKRQQHQQRSNMTTRQGGPGKRNVENASHERQALMVMSKEWCQMPAKPQESLLSVGIKSHDSESQGQEEAGHKQQTSKLFTGSTAVQFYNALNKLSLKLSLSYQGLSTFQPY